MTTLENSYCVPRTVEEWDMLMDMDTMCDNDNGTKIMSTKFNETIAGPYHDMGGTEIPVPRFLDLLHDRIVDWRLEEVGWEFVDRIFPYYHFKPNEKVTLSWSEKQQDAGVGFELADDETWVNITTFTDLLTLISFLKPDSND